MKLESLERLREWSCRPEIRDIADAIQAEVDERYMPLPLDADGVPIRFGDSVCEIDDCSPVRVMSLTYYEDCVDVNAYGMNPNLLRHVKPRTVDDVLREFAEAYASGEDVEIGSTDALFAKYAAELRMRDAE